MISATNRYYISTDAYPSEKHEIGERIDIPTCPVTLHQGGYHTGVERISSAVFETPGGWLRDHTFTVRCVFDFKDPSYVIYSKGQFASIIGYAPQSDLPDYEGFAGWKELAPSIEPVLYANYDHYCTISFAPIAGRENIPCTHYALISSRRNYSGNNGPIRFATKLPPPKTAVHYVVKGLVTGMSDLTDPTRLHPIDQEIIVTRDAPTTFCIVTNYPDLTKPTYDLSTRNNIHLPYDKLGNPALKVSPLPPEYYIYPVSFEVGYAGEVPDGYNLSDYLIAGLRLKVRTIY